MTCSGIKLKTVGLVATALATACVAGGEPPSLDPLADQVAKVGVELVLEIRATDPDGDDLSYSFDANVPGIHERAQLTRRPDGSAVFRWTPQAGDVDPGWAFDFTVSDGNYADTTTIAIEVRSEVGQAGAPVFVRPLGTGTTLDLGARKCVEIEVLVEDADTPAVELRQEEPVIAGAELEVRDGVSALWHWCPDERQMLDADRYLLTLSADDGRNEKTLKRYLVVLRKPPKPDCPGGAPEIRHTPLNERTLVNLTVTADITDDQGLKQEPLFYYSERAPANPPDLSQMTQLTMILLDGDMRNGIWGADVPNPVVAQPSGSAASLYYVIVANDNDDLAGDCDHLTQAPDSGSYSMTVTNPGGGGGAGLCTSCTADVQCGGAEDLCVRLGSQADPFCLSACSGPGDCPTNYTCAPSPVTSMGGVSARQCIPNSADCADPGGAVCLDDSFEDNDSLAEATGAVALAPGVYDFVSCGAGQYQDDEDFYRIEIDGDSAVEIEIDGDDVSDLDLSLLDAAGTAIDASVSLTSQEFLSRCLEPGTYYIRVFAYGARQNPYVLSFSRSASDCSASACEDDGDEDDDDPQHARYVEPFPEPYVSQTNAICSGDDDWYEVWMLAGDRLAVDLTFDQTNSREDLDLHFYDEAGVDLTPCEEVDPSTCSAEQGQSTTSNEHFAFTATDPTCAPCIYYVVVHGWNGSEGLYDIRMAIEE